MIPAILLASAVFGAHAAPAPDCHGDSAECVADRPVQGPMTREQMSALPAVLDESPLAQAALGYANIPSVFDGGKPFFFGPLPADPSGQLAPYLGIEGVNVLAPGNWRVSVRGQADNFHTFEESPRGRFDQKFETHTGALEVRRGFKAGFVPAAELGIKVQGHRNTDGGGALSGLISGFESAFGFDNPDRIGRKAKHGNQETVVLDGKTYRQTRNTGTGWEMGDVMLTVKGLLLDSHVGWHSLSIAARLAGNISSGSRFSSGSFAGFGLSAQLPLTERLAMHADLRQTVAFNSQDAMGLDLRRAATGASLGIEYMVFKKLTSLGFQVDWEQSKWKSGLSARDGNQLFLTAGVNQAIPLGQKCALAQIYAREDINPSRIGESDVFNPAGAPDFSAGAKVSFEWDRARCPN